MTEHNRLRTLLEPDTPRLDPAAAARLEARVDAALARRGRRGLPRWSLAAAPALVALALLLWFAPWQQGQIEGRAFVLTENEYLAALQDYQAAGGSLEDVFSTETLNESTDVDFDASDWNDEDWNLFRTELESFQLSENGGM